MEEYLESIRQCFELFLECSRKNIKDTSNLKLYYNTIRLAQMSLDHIIADANVLYMSYIVSATSAYSYNKESYVNIAYKQLMSMIAEYNTLHTRDCTMEYLKSENRRLEKEVMALRERLREENAHKEPLFGKSESPAEMAKKGWFS